MKNATIIIGTLVVMAASLVVSSCGNSNAETDENAAEKKQAQPIAVKVTELQPAPYGKEFVVMGIAKAYEDIMLSPEEGGVVKEWKYAKGAYVPKNAVVVVLKDELLKAGYEAALAQFKMAELNYQKQKKVYEEQAISELQFKDAQYNYESAKAAMELAKARLERTRLRAPVAGYLDQRMADPGEMAPPGVPLARIVDASRLRVQGEVPEHYAPEVRLGTPVRLVFDALPGDTISGRISYVGASVSSSNRALPVEVIIPNPSKKIKPEMVGKMIVRISGTRKALLVPQHVLQQVDTDRLVVYVEENGVARERRVTTGSRNGNTVEILSGLRPGDRVIVQGYQDLVDGQPVEVVQY